MTTTDAKIDFLGEMIGLDDLINRVEAMARIETSISDPWFIGECVYSCGNLPLTAPFETFGDFVNAFSNQQHLSSVTNDTGGLRFIFTVDGNMNAIISAVGIAAMTGSATLASLALIPCGRMCLPEQLLLIRPSLLRTGCPRRRGRAWAAAPWQPPSPTARAETSPRAPDRHGPHGT